MRLSLLDCLCKDGILDLGRFFQYVRDSGACDLSIIDSIDLMAGGHCHDSDGPAPLPAASEPRSRAPKVINARKDSENGPLVVITLEESLFLS